MPDQLQKGVFAGWVVIAIFFFSISMSYGSEWQIVGPRALGMGGANVAVANDSTASYWNPGAYGFFKGEEEDHYGKRGWSTTLAGVGVGAQLHGNIGDSLSKVTDINFDGIDNDNLTADKVTDFIALLNGIEEFRGQANQVLTITANGRFNIQAGHFGIGSHILLDVTANPNFDFDNLGPDNTTGFTVADFTDPTNLGCPTCGTASISVTTLTTQQANDINAGLPTTWTAAERNGFINSIDNGLGQAGVTVPSDIVTQATSAATLADVATAAASSGPLSQNTSTLRFVGIGLIEVPLSYGRAFSEKLSIGGNLKYMKARVYDVTIDILKQDMGDALDEALDAYQDKSNVGLDLGALYRLSDSFRVGIVGRNLNAPKFGSVKQEAQIRTGLAYQPRSFLTFAADIDLTENNASVGSSLKSRNIGAGLEIDVFKFLQLRFGTYKNLSENDIGIVYTAGFGLNLWLVNLDIGAAKSKDESRIDGEDVPEEARLEFALSMLF